MKTKDVCLKDKVESKVRPVKEQKIQTKSEKEQKQGNQIPQKNEVEELNNIQLIKEINPRGTVDMRDPLEVVSVGDGTVILVDSGLNYLQRINTEGNVIQKYQITISQHVTYRSACVYGNFLFVATSDDVITRMSLDGSGGSIKYKPEGVITINYISAVGDSVILISEYQWDARISEYNTETKEVIQRITDVVLPGKVSVVQDGHDTKYIVKWYNPTSGERIVKIYDRDWNQIPTMNINTDVLTVTPGGKLLIAYNEYSQDGRLITKLLDKYQFKTIQDITCDGCIWVLEMNPCCIKIFGSY